MSENPGQSTRPINLLLVNESGLIGNVISAALEDEPDIKVAASVTSMEEALKAVREVLHQDIP